MTYYVHLTCSLLDFYMEEVELLHGGGGAGGSYGLKGWPNR